MTRRFKSKFIYVKYFWNNVKVFTFTFDQFNASLVIQVLLKVLSFFFNEISKKTFEEG